MDQDKYLPELIAEKEGLDTSFVHAMRLLAEGKVCRLLPSFLASYLFAVVSLLYICCTCLCRYRVYNIH